MIEDLRNYSPEDIISANLRETGARAAMLNEQERAHLRELTAELIKGAENLQELVSSLPDLLPSDIFGESQRAYLPRNTLRRLTFCRELKLLFNADQKEFSEQFLSDTDGDVPAFDRIAYQRSSYADTAYLQFATLLRDPRAVYTHSFPAACEEIYNELCEYCILPLENSSEGPLNTFARLIDRFGLRIAATTDVTANDGTRTTCFALLRRTVFPLLGARDRAHFLEIAIPSDPSDSLAAVLLAAQLCEVKLCKVNTRQSPNDGRLVAHAIFQASDEQLTDLMLYLATDPIEYETVGLYSHVSEKTTQSRR